MAPTIETTTVAPRRYVGVRCHVKHDGIGPACARVLPRLEAWLETKGLSPDGPPAVVYHSMNRETGYFDLEPALFVSAPVEGEGDIAVGETPGGQALKTTHVGPYAALGETWATVFARAEELKRPVTRSAWELYVDDPREVPPERLRTEIYVPIDA